MDAKLFPSPIPLATLQVDCSRGSPRVGRGSRKDARPRNLAGGRCPLPAWVPAVQPSGHALGAETQVLSTPPSRLARGSRAGGCPEIAQGRAGTGAWRGGGVSRDQAGENLARDSPTVRSGQPLEPLGCVLTADFLSFFFVFIL